MPYFKRKGLPGLWRFGSLDDESTLYICDGCRHTFAVTDEEISAARRERGDPAFLLEYCDACFPYHRGVHDRRKKALRKDLSKRKRIAANLREAYDDLSDEDRERFILRTMEEIALQRRSHVKYRKAKRKHAPELLAEYIGHGHI